MSWRFCLILFIGVLLEWKLTLSAPAEIGKTKEKGRAYEFGFSIEEQQHRHEKRDENGIVMGEFGFITADGIYHVTVYATDENGKFKIISMKNYPYGNPEKKIMIATVPPTKKPVVTPTTGVKAMMPDGKSCGGCVLPKKMNLQPADVKGKKPDNEKQPIFRPLSKDLDANGKTNGEAAKKGKSTPTKQSEPPSSTANTGKGSSASKQALPQIDDDESDYKINVRFDDDTSSKLEPTIPANNAAKTSTSNTQSTNKQSSPTAPSSQATTGKTTPSNTGGDSNNSKVGGGGGPLYRFNYILDYNSHREEGRIDGSKEGKYNTLHEDGIRRIIDYIANENGYQPHIKLERLPPNDLPTGENKLKEYEFVWFN